MRYAVISHPGAWGLSEVEAKVKQYGGRDIRLAPMSGQVFCDLDPEKAALLAQLPGLVVRPVEKIKLQEAGDKKQDPSLPVLASGLWPPASGVYSAAQTALSTLFFDFRMMFDPPVTGAGFTIA
ncbi:MAG: hypothetical protein Q7R39_15320, partial [Dehalococcoidia bacterium]|nr:hypothetical protein [Dehalococcoidia bacterium]